MINMNVSNAVSSEVLERESTHAKNKAKHKQIVFNTSFLTMDLSIFAVTKRTTLLVDIHCT